MDDKYLCALFGSLGGRARARKLTPKQRSDQARKAVQERWRRAKADQKKASGAARRAKAKAGKAAA